MNNKSIVDKAMELCCCATYRALGLDEKCGVCQLVDAFDRLDFQRSDMWRMINTIKVDPDFAMSLTERLQAVIELLGETNDALAACQSQAAGEMTWRDGLINEAKELLKVMPSEGLSARDFALWNRRRALFIGLHLWVGPFGAVRWTHCKTCGVVQRADGKNGPCRGPSRVSTRGRRMIAPRKDDVLDAVGSIMACCESGQPHIPRSDDPTQCMVCGATVTVTEGNK